MVKLPLLSATVAVAVSCSADIWSTGTDAVLVVDTGPPCGSRPLATTPFVTVPASTSAWVMTYGAAAAQVVAAWGASVVAGQLKVSPAESVTASPVTVVEPELVTVTAQPTWSPRSVRPSPSRSVTTPAAVTARAAGWRTGAWPDADGEVTARPSGPRPAAVATVETAPAATSAGATTWTSD